MSQSGQSEFVAARREQEGIERDVEERRQETRRSRGEKLSRFEYEGAIVKYKRCYGMGSGKQKET